MDSKKDSSLIKFKKPPLDGDSYQKKGLSDSRKTFLKPREFKVDFESKVNTSEIIPRINGKARVGHYCEICDYAATDSGNFTNHLNGKQHQKNMNMSMRIQRSTVDDVKLRFEANYLHKQGKHKRLTIQEVVDLLKKKSLKNENKKPCEDEEETHVDINTIDIEEEESRMRDTRRQERKRGKKRKFEPIENEESQDKDDMASLMGFSGFGGSKKNI